jgi:thiamine pyrophosphokinase
MNALIIANGVPPSKALARRLADEAAFVLCADGGANHAVRLGVLPDLVIGDLDSITAATKRALSSVPRLRIREQYSTDLEKAIRYALRRKATTITVLGATGKRIDHTAGNLGCFRRFGERCNLRFVDDDGELSTVGRSTSLVTRPGEVLSLIPLGPCTGVTTSGLRYGLRGATLELGVREGTSNLATGARVTVRVRTGTLLLYRLHGMRERA